MKFVQTRGSDQFTLLLKTTSIIPRLVVFFCVCETEILPLSLSPSDRPRSPLSVPVVANIPVPVNTQTCLCKSITVLTFLIVVTDNKSITLRTLFILCLFSTLIKKPYLSQTSKGQADLCLLTGTHKLFISSCGNLHHIVRYHKEKRSLCEVSAKYASVFI